MQTELRPVERRMLRMNYVIQYLSWENQTRKQLSGVKVQKWDIEGGRDVNSVGCHIFLQVGQIMPYSVFFFKSLLSENFVKNKTVFNFLN